MSETEAKEGTIPGKMIEDGTLGERKLAQGFTDKVEKLQQDVSGNSGAIVVLEKKLEDYVPVSGTTMRGDITFTDSYLRMQENANIVFTKDVREEGKRLFTIQSTHSGGGGVTSYASITDNGIVVNSPRGIEVTTLNNNKFTYNGEHVATVKDIRHYYGSDYISVSDQNIISLKYDELQNKLISEGFAKKSDIPSIDLTPYATKTELSGYVPTSRKINGKSLTGDITLTAGDVSAATAADITTAINNAFARVTVAATEEHSPTAAGVITLQETNIRSIVAVAYAGILLNSLQYKVDGNTLTITTPEITISTEDKVTVIYNKGL